MNTGICISNRKQPPIIAAGLMPCSRYSFIFSWFNR